LHSPLLLVPSTHSVMKDSGTLNDGCIEHNLSVCGEREQRRKFAVVVPDKS